MTPHRLTARDPLPVLLRAEDAAAGLDAGIVHEDVGAAEALAHRRLQRGHGLPVALTSVSTAITSSSPPAAARSYGGRVASRLGAEVGDADVQAERGEAARRRRGRCRPRRR